MSRDWPSPLKNAALLTSPILPFFFLILGVLIFYSNIYGNTFLYDDTSVIVNNQYIRDGNHFRAIFTSSLTSGASVAGAYYRPLQTLIYWFVFHLFGLSTLAFHVPNVLLHAANACLILCLGKRLGLTPQASWIGAFLWSLHPAHVEAITYMSGTAEPLYAFFTLAGLCVLFPVFSWKRIMWAAPFYILALLSKETALLFPLLVCACLWFQSPRRYDIETYLPTLPYFFMAVTYYILRTTFLTVDQVSLYTQQDVYVQSPLCRFYTFLGVLPSYTRILFWPTGLHFDRNFPALESPLHASVLGGAVIVGASFLTPFIKSAYGKVLRFSLLWFGATDCLHSGVLLPLNAILLEHWLYLPSVGFFFAAGEGMTLVMSSSFRQRIAITALSILALFWGSLTFLQNRVWQNEETLYASIFAHGEPSPHAHNNLAILYTRRGEYDKAVEQYRLAINYSGDNSAQAHHNLAITLLNGPHGKELQDEVIRHFERALAIDPTFFPASFALAEMYRQAGDVEKEAFYDQKTKEIKEKLGFKGLQEGNNVLP